MLGKFWCNFNAYESTWLDDSYFLDLLTLTLHISISIDFFNGGTKGACQYFKK